MLSTQYLISQVMNQGKTIEMKQYIKKPSNQADKALTSI